MRQRLWDISALAVVIAVVIAHVSFLLADERIPQDPGLYYRALPELHAAWSSGDVATLARGLTESSGWYNAMVGLTMAIFGVSTLAFSLFDALWVGLILLGVAMREGDCWPNAAGKMELPAVWLILLGAAIPEGDSGPNGAGEMELPAVCLILLGSNIAQGVKAPNDPRRGL